MEMQDEDFKNSIPEKLNLAKDTQNLDVEVRAILEHLTKSKDTENKS